MSRDMDILVKTEQSLDSMAKELEALLDMSAHRVTDDEETWYELQDEHTFLSVGGHEYVNNQGIDFESYNYDIQVSAINIKSAEERIKWLYDCTRMVFNKLKETQKYSLLLVDNLQVKLDEYPGPTERRTRV